MTGGTVSLTKILVVQTLEQPILEVTLSVKEKGTPQAEPALTVTVWELVAPVIEPLPAIDQE